MSERKGSIDDTEEEEKKLHSSNRSHKVLKNFNIPDSTGNEFNIAHDVEDSIPSDNEDTETNIPKKIYEFK